MIVILCDQLDRRSKGTDPVFSLTADLELLNRPYLDRLADEYRRLGARRILRAAEPVRAADLQRSKLVLAADVHLWPGSETRRAIELFEHSRAGLGAFVKPRGRGYAEVIEFAGDSAGCAVTRCYPHTEANTTCLAALLIRPRRLGRRIADLLGGLREQDADALLAAAAQADQAIEGRPFWINSVGQYLLLVEKLLADQGCRGQRARAIGDNVWAMPGAALEPDCVVQGPVLFGRDCRIGRGSSIIGPAVIGDCVHVGEQCLVGGSVLLKGTELPRQTRVWSSVLAPGRWAAEDRSVAYAWMSTGTRWLPTSSQAEFDSVVVPSARALILRNPRLFAAAKRAVDVAGALAGLALTLPLYPFIALAVKLDNPGPVFFAHRRQTLGGREFGCLKFRTMRRDTHPLQQVLQNEVDGPQFYIKDDPRVTRVGRLLRRTRLDETPQFWNVLLGQMSLVGPRPSPHKENQFCPAWREARLSVRAGLTGLWQTQGSPDRSVGGFHEWIHYDSQYIKEYSLRTDLKVLWDTVRRLVT